MSHVPLGGVGFLLRKNKTIVNVTIENLAPCRKLLRVEVDAQTVDSSFNEVTSEFQKQAKLPGFRPGKAPRDLIARTYGKAIEDEVKKKLVSDNFRKALQEHKVRAVSPPEIEEIQFGRGQSLQFAATIETAPEIELPDYRGLPVKRPVQMVTEDDIERALQVLRDRGARYDDVPRPVQSGDYVVVNYTAASEGKPLTEISPTAKGLTEQKNFWMHVAHEHFVPGFTDQLIGASAGEKRRVEVQFPADFVAPALSGKPAVYEVEVVQVKEKIVPEVNEEFARKYGAENLEKLREGIRIDLQNELTYKQRKSIRNQLVKELVRRVQCDLPDSMVQAETRNVVYDIVRENQERGIPAEAIEQQKEGIMQYASDSARDRVKIAFILRQIADKERIQVTNEELRNRVLAMAQQYQIAPDKFVKQLQERNGVAEVEEQIMTSKVLDFLEANARIEETPLEEAANPS
jgi:trigger factor